MADRPAAFFQTTLNTGDDNMNALLDELLQIAKSDNAKECGPILKQIARWLGDAIAEETWHFYEQLQERGFSEDQAFQIVLSQAARLEGAMKKKQ
jgi:hypothetical protein